MTIHYPGLAGFIEQKRAAAVEAGNVCKHCGEAIADPQSYYHIVSFMTLCGGGRNTYAELKEQDE
jgi:hypothetical protein